MSKRVVRLLGFLCGEHFWCRCRCRCRCRRRRRRRCLCSRLFRSWCRRHRRRCRVGRSGLWSFDNRRGRIRYTCGSFSGVRDLGLGRPSGGRGRRIDAVVAMTRLASGVATGLVGTTRVRRNGCGRAEPQQGSSNHRHESDDDLQRPPSSGTPSNGRSWITDLGRTRSVPVDC